MGNISDDLLGSHHNLFFEDWKRTVTYTRVSSSTNIDTGAITETTTASSVDAVPTSKTERIVGSSGGRYLVYERRFEIKTADLPEDPPRTTSRITHDLVYDVVAHQKSADGLVTIVVGRANKS